MICKKFNVCVENVTDQMDRLFWIERFLVWNGERESMAAIFRGSGVGDDFVVENVPRSSNMPMVFENWEHCFMICISYEKKKQHYFIVVKILFIPTLGNKEEYLNSMRIYFFILRRIIPSNLSHRFYLYFLFFFTSFLYHFLFSEISFSYEKEAANAGQKYFYMYLTYTLSSLYQFVFLKEHFL